MPPVIGILARHEIIDFETIEPRDEDRGNDIDMGNEALLDSVIAHRVK